MKHRIAVIAGDGIGQEVMPEGLRVLEAAMGKFGLALEFTTFTFNNSAVLITKFKSSLLMRATIGGMEDGL